WAAAELLQIVALDVQFAAGQAPVAVGEDGGVRLRQAGADQYLGVGGLGQVGVVDLPAAVPGHLLGQLGHGERCAAQFVHLVGVALGGEHRGGRLGEVRAGGGADPALTGRAGYPVFEVAR